MELAGDVPGGEAKRVPAASHPAYIFGVEFCRNYSPGRHQESPRFAVV